MENNSRKRAQKKGNSCVVYRIFQDLIGLSSLYRISFGAFLVQCILIDAKINYIDNEYH